MTYYLEVEEWDNTAGSFTLTLTPPASPPAAPASAPTVTATGAGGKTKLSWGSLFDATSYNIYWSTTPGVTTANGTKISGVPAGISTTTYIHTGLAAGTYYYIVTGVNVCTEGPASTEKSATVTAAGAALLSSNFDNNTLQGWTASGTWGVTSTSSHSGSYSVTDSPGGNYTNSTMTTVTSPVFDLTASTLPTLTFYHRGSLGLGDYCQVQVSTDGGSVFSTAKNIYSLPSTFTLDGIDLSAAKTSSTVVIRFRLITDSSTVGDGWYIDDIEVLP